MHGDVGVHVHAAGVVAGVAVDLDVERRIEPGGDGMRAVGVEDLHALHACADRVAVQVAIDLAQRRRRQIEEFHAFHEYTSSGLRLEHIGVPHARQVRERAELRGDGDVVVRLGDHRRLAGEGIAHDEHFLVGAHEEREEAIELGKAAMHGGSQVIALAHAPLEEAAGGLGVVVGDEADAERLELLAHQVRIGQRAVVHQAEILAGRERMRMRGRDRGFRGHARVRHHVRARAPCSSA